MTRYLKRYEDRDRVNHWLIALLFFLAALSGLAFFHPSLFFLANLFGGGPWARILHPFLGLVMFVLFAAFAVRHWRDNVIDDADREWSRHSRGLLMGDKAPMPPAGKFNAGQKILFWLIVACMSVLLLAGIVFWRPWFAPYFGIGLIRSAALLHALAAAGLVLLIIGHIYMAIWTRGSIRGMTRGIVSETWARANHALWYRKMTRGS